jgi:tetratricopeptide (TPR) repeat protein
MGEKGYLSLMADLESRALYALERYDEAEQFASLSQELAASDDVESQAIWRSTRAQVLACQGRFQEAEQLARKAVEIIDGTDDLDERANTRMELAEVLRLAGSPYEATDAVQAALELYEQKGNLVRAERTRTRLHELRGAAESDQSQ